MNRSGTICSWFLNGFGSCFLNGSRCDNPFSCEGCEIQCKRIFGKTRIESHHRDYTPSKKNEILTKSEVIKQIEIKKGDIIAHLFIPYFAFIAESVSDTINLAHEQIDEKFKSEHYNEELAEHWIFQNVHMFDSDGIYVIGIIRK